MIYCLKLYLRLIVVTLTKSNKMKKYLKYSVLLIMAGIFFLGRAKAQVYKTNNGEITFVSKTDFEKFKLSSKSQKVKVKGMLNIHGVDHEELVNGTIQETKDGVVLKADFSIELEDYNINIPKNNINDIAETIEINVNCLLINKPKK